MNLAIKNITFEELSTCDNFDALIKEYAEEATVAGMPQIGLDKDTYDKLSKAGALHIFGAYVDDILIGFIAVINKILPHNGVQITISDAIFVNKENRKIGIGAKLIHKAEEYAVSQGSYGMVIGAPIGGNFIDALPYIGYTPTNLLFFRKLK